MQNAALCIPYDYMFLYASPSTGGTDAQYLRNDEPGLIWAPQQINDPNMGTGSGFNIDLGEEKDVRFFSMLGLQESNYSIRLIGASSPSFSAASILYQADCRANFSADRSARQQMKHLHILPTKIKARYWAVRVSTGSRLERSWRLLIGDMIQPIENLNIDAEDGVDDRSVRRYTRTGRRVIDPTVIVPSFQGEWPVLEDFEYRAIRKWLRNAGATKPAMIVLDTQMDTDTPYGGEDGIYYGDFEKSAKLVLKEGYYSFSFAVVSIAP